MRTIKFRGKTCKDNVWVYGQYLESTISLRNRKPHKSWIAQRVMSNGGFIALTQRYPVIDETVGQYTGLQDKNGVEIYEGDILQETYSNKNVLVVYDAPQFCYADNSFGYRFLNHPENFTVVGNIHDNPDLLKGE
jgi:uncharacterized phage protein (TIGR01671 family)